MATAIIASLATFVSVRLWDFLWARRKRRVALPVLRKKTPTPGCHLCEHSETANYAESGTATYCLRRRHYVTGKKQLCENLRSDYRGYECDHFEPKGLHDE